MYFCVFVLTCILWTFDYIHYHYYHHHTSFIHKKTTYCVHTSERTQKEKRKKGKTHGDRDPFPDDLP